MPQEVITAVPQLHIRYNGRSIDINLTELDIGSLSTDPQIRAATANHLGVPVAKLQTFVVDPPMHERTESTHLTLRPDATFACA